MLRFNDSFRLFLKKIRGYHSYVLLTSITLIIAGLLLEVKETNVPIGMGLVLFGAYGILGTVLCLVFDDPEKRKKW